LVQQRVFKKRVVSLPNDSSSTQNRNTGISAFGRTHPTLHCIPGHSNHQQQTQRLTRKHHPLQGLPPSFTAAAAGAASALTYPLLVPIHALHDRDSKLVRKRRKVAIASLMRSDI
jgi:hypothetical protein